MEIISQQHTSKFFYDKFSAGFLTPDYNLLLNDQFCAKEQYFITLQEYELSKEWIIWISSDLFAEFQFDDVWLVFPITEKSKVENIFAILKFRLAKIGQKKTPRLFKQYLYSIIDELDKESLVNEKLPVAA